MPDLLPFVTVIMPIRNEASFIGRSLGAVLDQTYPPDRFEVLVADGMSTDATRIIVAELAAQHPHHCVTIIDNPGWIVPTGFNLAVAQAQGEIVVRVDGHTIIAPDYVAECVRLLQTTDAANVGGRMRATSEIDFGQAVAAATSSPFGVGGARFHYSEQHEWVDTVYMGAWWKRTFDQIGGFDERFVRNQDDEFNYRLRVNGGKILLSPTIKSTYYNRSSLRALWRQYYQYGYYKVMVMHKHPSQIRLRQLAPLLLVSVIVGGTILAPFSVLFRVLWLLACAVYLTANFGASWKVARDEQLPSPLPLIVIFAALHFGYGFGFWHRLVKFLILHSANG